MTGNRVYKRGEVVQLNEKCRNVSFVGCFMLVTEAKSFGAMGFIQLPCEPPINGPCCLVENGRGQAFYRATFEEMDYVGKAAIVPASEAA